MTTKTTLILAWVDLDGFELTGGYRDALRHYPATRTVPQARAARWGANTSKLRTRLYAHIVAEQMHHVWMGWFALREGTGMMDDARRMALEAYKKAVDQASTMPAKVATR